DGIMVARGDLGVEMDVWQVPIVQKGIVAACRLGGKPVIVATQMLQSMVSSPMPTRAEVSDVANAILDNADAIMLSAETAAGEFPLAAVEMMQRVSRATEAYSDHRERPALDIECSTNVNRRVSAIAHGAVHAAMHLGAKLVAVWSASGDTVRHLSRHRLPMPVVGLTYDESVARRMNLYYGVTPLHVDPISNPVALVDVLNRRLIAEGLAKPGDVIIVVSSRTPMKSGETDTMLVHRVR
ncbi:MAG: pyruvate kinase, partial [Phycisphaerae bacterium]